MPVTPNLVLTRLAPEHANAYLDMVGVFEAAGEGYPYNKFELARTDFPAFVRELEDEEHGIGLPPGIAPRTTYVPVRDSTTIAGEIRFRPLTAPPYRPGHDHIGYNVRPTERLRGCATFMLARVLGEAKALGLPGVALAVEGNNPGSVRTITGQGGVLARQAVDPESGTALALYWIRL